MKLNGNLRNIQNNLVFVNTELKLPKFWQKNGETNKQLKVVIMFLVLRKIRHPNIQIMKNLN